MISRRSFSITAGAAGSALLLRPSLALAQPVKVLKMANAAGVNDAQQCFITAGRHPKLGYYSSEGVDIEYVNMSSVSQTLQAIATAQVTFGTLVPGLYLPAIAKEPSLNVVAVYNWLPRNATAVVVKPGSPLLKIADLYGKRIGIRNQGDPGVFVIRAMFKELGLDDSTTQFIAVGDGASAGLSLQQDRVDAIATNDTIASRIELVGIALRYLPLTPNFARISGAYFGVGRTALKEDRKSLVGLFRGMAKSTLFARANLDQAINIHWALYPESKPKSKADEEARKEVKFLLRERKENWMRQADDPEQRMGASTLPDWQASLAIAADAAKDPSLPSKLPDLSRVFSNDLIGEINDFDKEAVVRQAKSFTL